MHKKETAVRWKIRDPEMKTLDDFIEYLMDDERTQVFFPELVVLSRSTRTSISKLSAALKEWGFEVPSRAKPTAVRGYNTSSHDRWYGPGSEATHGGSGFDNF